MTADPFDAPDAGPAAGEETLTVDVDGFEGPLDLLLELARRQKVDLSRISVLALARQYLAFIEEAETLRLELAADYLVMAAWLAFLKSRLLLPLPPRGEEAPAADLADALAHRLRRLEAMRGAAAALQRRPQLGRDVFARGMPEGVRPARGGFEATLYDLLSAYARQRQKAALSQVRLPERNVWTLAEARDVIEDILREEEGWADLAACLRRRVPDAALRATATASSFLAALELAREGRLLLRQEGAFGPVLLRAAGTG